MPALLLRSCACYSPIERTPLCVCSMELNKTDGLPPPSPSLRMGCFGSGDIWSRDILSQDIYCPGTICRRDNMSPYVPIILLFKWATFWETYCPSHVPHIPSYTLIYSHIPFVAKKLVPGQNVAPKSWYRDKMSRLKVGTGTKCRAYEHPRAPSKQTSSATYCPGTIYVLGQNVAGQNVS